MRKKIIVRLIDAILILSTACAILISGTSLAFNFPIVGNYKMLAAPLLMLIMVSGLTLKFIFYKYKFDNQYYLPYLFYLFTVAMPSIFSIYPDKSLRQIMIMVFFIMIYLGVAIFHRFRVIFSYSAVIIASIGIFFSFLFLIIAPLNVNHFFSQLFKPETLIYRSYANFYLDRNVPVSSFFLTVPLFYYFFLMSFRSRPKTGSPIWHLLFIISLTSTVLTNGRAMVLTAFLSFIGYVVLMKTTIPNFRFSLRIKTLFFAVFFVFIFMEIAGKTYGANVLNRFFLQRQKDKQSILARVGYLREAWNIFKVRPIIGFGVNNYRYTESEPTIPENYRQLLSPSELYVFAKADHAHNVVFTHLAETGIIGTVGLLVFFFTIIKHDLRWLKNLRSYRKANFEQIAFNLSQVSISWSFIFISIIAGEWTAYSLLIFFVSRGLAVASKNEILFGTANKVN